MFSEELYPQILRRGRPVPQDPSWDLTVPKSPALAIFPECEYTGFLVGATPQCHRLARWWLRSQLQKASPEAPFFPPPGAIALLSLRKKDQPHAGNRRLPAMRHVLHGPPGAMRPTIRAKVAGANSCWRRHRATTPPPPPLARPPTGHRGHAGPRRASVAPAATARLHVPSCNWASTS